LVNTKLTKKLQKNLKMELNINLKDEQREFIDKIAEENYPNNFNELIQALINGVLSEYNDDDVFKEIRCVGGCFSTDQSLKVELSDELILKIKNIFQNFDFEDYDSEEEELGKVIRSIVNFADQDGDLKKILK